MAELTNANWANFDSFKKGALVKYNDTKYLCLVDHKRLENKPPHMHPFWAVIHVTKHG